MTNLNNQEQWERLETERQMAIQFEKETVLSLMIPAEEKSKLQLALKLYRAGELSLSGIAEQTGMDRYLLLWALSESGIKAPARDDQAEAMAQAGERARQQLFAKPLSNAQLTDADQPLSDEDLLSLIHLAQESLTIPQENRVSPRGFLNKIRDRLAV
jgi:predicted HTH domain antitoxin